MNITCHKNHVFKIDTDNTSYIISISEFGHILHRYYGAYVSDFDISDEIPVYTHASNSPHPSYAPENYSLDTLMQEYSTYNNGDMRCSALSIKNNDGYCSSALVYSSYEIIKGKPELSSLPSSYVENEQYATTLIIKAKDDYNDVEVLLKYSVFEDSDIIARSSTIVNVGNKKVSLMKVSTMTLDFIDENFDLIQTYGTWAKEQNIDRNNIAQGIHLVSSKRGSSSHMHNPSIILANKETDEFHGQSYGINLIYSTNFSIEIEKDYFSGVRVVAGINSDGFEWVLNPQEKFETPEVMLTYSNKGLNGLSQNLHKFIRKNICRGEWQYKKRPILINSWEAAYFKFTEDTLYEFAKSAKKLGIEMLVMDDGWFGKRSNDKTSMGDWVVNIEKIPSGLKSLVDKINKLGMSFGIWFEPEMISQVSDLYEKHPDWCMCIPNRDVSLGRNQLVIDMTRQDVVDYLFDVMSDILSSCNIAYLKWDFNRNISEAASVLLDAANQGELFHRYVIGLYELLSRITKAFPNVLLESCSGGGGRFDSGMLCFSPQIWASDNTDPIHRMQIQYGTSMMYPISVIGSHVSASPNHQTGRQTPMDIRANVAICGTFGYELNPCLLNVEEQEKVKEQISNYHRYYQTIQNGTFYRLINPFEDANRCAWQIISEKEDEILLFYYVTQIKHKALHCIKFVGLIEDALYEEKSSGKLYHGNTLMNIGLHIKNVKDLYDSTMIVLSRRNS